MSTADDSGQVDPYRPPGHRSPGADKPNPTSPEAGYPHPAAAITLFLITAAGCWAAGGPVFAVTIIAIASAHAFGHFYVARRHGVGCSGPYFVPYHFPFGISGAFLRMQWPIKSRRALIRIFLAGPIVGLAVSVLAIVVGLLLSRVIEPSSGGLVFNFGTSILTLLLERLLVGDVEPDQVLLSPIAWAGWLGVQLNFWQLLPLGRFDGGRVLAAVVGYWNFVPISVLILVIWFGWAQVNGTFPYVALVAFATHLRLKEQYEDMDHEPLPLGQAIGALCVLGFLLLITYPLFSAGLSII